MVTIQDIRALKMPWEPIEAIINGVSSLDLSSMPIQDWDEAYHFMLSYGYDMHHPEDAAEIHLLYKKALQFIQDYFLGEKREWICGQRQTFASHEIPASIQNIKDVLTLLITASSDKSPDNHWACAVLKVMHVLAHIQNGLYYRQVDVAREQILKNFYDVLDEQDDGTFILRGTSGQSLHLYSFEAKPEKTLESTLVKLLCKKEMITHDIYDLIGVRLVTNTPAEAILATQILREQKVILFPNVIPTRSRNTLIDLKLFRESYDTLLEFIEIGDKEFTDLEEFFKNFNSFLPENKSFENNQASSPNYRSIHITCRQLIRTLIPETHLENRYFMPYEIQILDRQSYFDSHHGSSAHQQYKKRQFRNAGRRVLGPLLLKKNSKPKAKSQD